MERGSVREQIAALCRMAAAEARNLHADHINPRFVEALSLLGYGRAFVRAEGCRLWDDGGREVLDFLAGYGALPLGHSHPDVRAALEEVLGAGLPQFLLVSPQPPASALASRRSARRRRRWCGPSRRSPSSGPTSIAS